MCKFILTPRKYKAGSLRTLQHPFPDPALPSFGQYKDKCNKFNVQILLQKKSPDFRQGEVY
jgi:hypothetical protein